MPTIDPVTTGMTLPLARPERAAADGLEALFLEKMLDGVGLRAREGTFSGGAGEQQFQSLLTEQYARILAGSIDLKLGIDAR